MQPSLWRVVAVSSLCWAYTVGQGWCAALTWTPELAQRVAAAVREAAGGLPAIRMAHLALTPAVPEMALPSMVTDTPDAASPEETPPASPRITDAYANPASGRFSVTLTTLPEGTAYTLHGQYVPLIAVVVPAQPIAAGTPLTSGLLTTAWQPAHIAQADWITDPAAAMGKTARFALPIGKPLRAPMLALPLVIARQAPVQLRYVRGSMQLRTEGIALEEGRVGASIRVRNLQSQKEIVGIVRDANTVEIDPDSPR